ncbi:hypothetical protein [Maribacter sp.]|uniref:hypothetical protein n=1 Tax=Maribacter sp. TaxID=1897614 RepID=UPI0025C66ECC|nr:hypothetical protein [Maribacter sp.]
MSNLISSNAKFFSMSNGFTTVVYSVLLISGNKLAKTYWEKQTMIWLAEHDQHFIGNGCAGIDTIKHIEWIKDQFSDQKKFLMQIAQNTIDNKVWKVLEYQTNEEVVIKFLNKWVEIFESVKIEDIDFSNTYFWYAKSLDTELENYCEIHSIRLNKLGKNVKECCFICNDA